VLPHAFRVVLPALGNQFISLIKDSSLAVAISVRELTYAAVRINDISWRIVEVYSVIAGMYLAVTYVVAVGLRGLEGALRKRS
jgi:glutamine transport system permease protein